MKHILLAIVAAALLQAESQMMTRDEHSSIHNTNYRPSIKLQKKQNMHRIHRIDEKEAAVLIKSETGEEAITLKLVHRGQYLFYKANTKNYSIELNAIDATFIKKSKHE